MEAAPLPSSGVRPARPGDVAAVSALQAAGWREVYGATLPGDVLGGLVAAALEPAWRLAVERPPSVRHRVLVAVDGGRVLGFAATAPAEDPDVAPDDCAELLALVVDPQERGTGHGSRLVQAAVDLLRESGMRSAVCWLGEVESGLAAFLHGAGWEEDGARRTLDVRGDGSVTVAQRRLATVLPAP